MNRQFTFNFYFVFTHPYPPPFSSSSSASTHPPPPPASQPPPQQNISPSPTPIQCEPPPTCQITNSSPQSMDNSVAATSSQKEKSSLPLLPTQNSVHLPPQIASVSYLTKTPINQNIACKLPTTSKRLLNFSSRRKRKTIKKRKKPCSAKYVFSSGSSEEETKAPLTLSSLISDESRLFANEGFLPSSTKTERSL